MSMVRVAFVLVMMLAVLLCVTVLRSETVRLENQLSRLEREAIELWQTDRAKELELARLRNPMIIRARVAEALSERQATATAAAPGPGSLAGH